MNEVQRLDDVGRALPLITFSLNCIQTGKRLESSIPSIQCKEDCQGPKYENEEFGAIAQARKASLASGQ